MCWIVSGWATALTIAGIEALRIYDELEALQILEHHRQLVPATFLVVVTLTPAAPALVQWHQFLGSGSLSSTTSRLRCGEHVQRCMRNLASCRPTVVKKFQFEAVVLQTILKPARSRFGGVQFHPSRIRWLALRDLAPQQETPRDRRAEIDQRLEIAWMSVIAFEEEPQRRVIDRDVLRVAGNRDGKVQGVTVVPSPQAEAKARFVPRMLCNEKERPMSTYIVTCE